MCTHGVFVKVSRRILRLLLALGINLIFSKLEFSKNKNCEVGKISKKGIKLGSFVGLNLNIYFFGESTRSSVSLIMFDSGSQLVLQYP